MIQIDVDALATAVAAKIVDMLRAGTFSDLIDQAQSPLGRRTHIALARSRPDCCVQIGRRFLVPKDLVEEELARSKPKKQAAPVTAPEGYEVTS